jgi:hypothetical protein
MLGAFFCFAWQSAHASSTKDRLGRKRILKRLRVALLLLTKHTGIAGTVGAIILFSATLVLLRRHEAHLEPYRDP